MVSFTWGFSTGEGHPRTAGLKKLSMDLGEKRTRDRPGRCPHRESRGILRLRSVLGRRPELRGVQRNPVAAPVYGAFRQRFLEATARLVAGDPSDEQTDVGPMISPTALQELRSRLDVALGAGAVLLSGNVTGGNVLQPTVLEAYRRTAACGGRRFSALWSCFVI